MKFTERILMVAVVIILLILGGFWLSPQDSVLPDGEVSVEFGPAPLPPVEQNTSEQLPVAQVEQFEVQEDNWVPTPVVSATSDTDTRSRGSSSSSSKVIQDEVDSGDQTSGNQTQPGNETKVPEDPIDCDEQVLTSQEAYDAFVDQCDEDHKDPEDPVAEVPEFGTIGALLVLIGAGVLVYKRRP